MPRRRQALGLAIAGSVALLGCASGGVEDVPGAFRAAGFQRPPPGSALLLLHLPAQVATFRAGDAPAQQQVAQLLTTSGYRVTGVQPTSFGVAYRKHLEQATRVTLVPTDSQREEAFDRAFSELVSDLCHLTRAAAVLRTRFVIRRASLWQSVAQWDGVARQLAFHDAKPGQVKANVEGEGWGVSLELVVVSCQGQTLLKRFGGIALPHVWFASGAGVPVDNPFTEPRHLAEGIRLALQPLLAE